MIIERAGTDAISFCEVFELLLKLHETGGYAPLDVDKASANTYRILQEGMVFVARDDDDKVIGTLGFTEHSFWYHDSTFLQDVWFFVLPEYRAGKVGIELMRAAKALADEKNKIAFVTVTNPARRPKATTMSLESQIAGYMPLGYTIKIK